TANGLESLSVSEGTSVLSSQGLGELQGNGAVYCFPGGGYGHNLGMSQYGAKALADPPFGYNYRDILQFYYTGVTVGK
ncbi:MAG TPA: stage II sporulation protein SpoIID, partial [Bacillota bacterium]|nr:stage II sporulation protein SpoIID [Bacillota bacterium]